MQRKSIEQPLVSVLLPVYNGARYLGEAVESILHQSYRDFELIIVNDGSTDDSAAVIAHYQDPRIRYIEQENRGLSASLNRAVALSAGTYLARQDSDDVSFPLRLEKQVAFLQSHPQCGMVGTWAEIWKEREKTRRRHAHPANNPMLQLELLFNNPFVHSSIMMRRDLLDEVGLYTTDPLRQPPEDYELWSRIARKFQVANVAEPLHLYRETRNSISREKWDRIMDVVVTISAENIAAAAGLAGPDSRCVNAAALANAVFARVEGAPELDDMKQVVMGAAERLAVRFPGDARQLRKRARFRWRVICQNYIRYRIRRFLAKGRDR